MMCVIEFGHVMAALACMHSTHLTCMCRGWNTRQDFICGVGGGSLEIPLNDFLNEALQEQPAHTIPTAHATLSQWYTPVHGTHHVPTHLRTPYTHALAGTFLPPLNISCWWRLLDSWWTSSVMLRWMS